MAMDFFEEAMRTELLQNFDSEPGSRIEEVYGQRWEEDVDIFYDGPMALSFSGPSAATNESNTSDFRVESDIYDDSLHFTMNVHDLPFGQDEVMEGNGNVDMKALQNAYSHSYRGMEFDPEQERTRFVQFTPEMAGGKPESFEDRWHVFNDVVEDVVNPDIHFTANGYDHVYTVPLRDTQENQDPEMLGGGTELP